MTAKAASGPLKGPLRVDPATLLCAVRYAVRHRGYAVVAIDVIANRDRLEPSERLQVQQDIAVAVTEGEACDLETWQHVAREIA